MTIEEIAKVSHEINKAYCESIGDNSQTNWEVAPEWQKSSAITGVKFHIDNPEASPAASHESWLAQKAQEGWKYGPVKNPETKEHPCFVPYDQLPVEQRSKDYLFKQTVHSLKEFIAPEKEITETPTANIQTPTIPPVEEKQPEPVKPAVAKKYKSWNNPGRKA